MELSDELYDRIEELSETGNEAMESEDYAKAISCFQEALDILPEPKEDWEAYLWLVGSIGDAHFMMGNYGKSLEFFRKCYNIGETDNPFILLRLGENYLEMKPMQLNFFSAPICSKGKRFSRKTGNISNGCPGM